MVRELKLLTVDSLATFNGVVATEFCFRIMRSYDCTGGAHQKPSSTSVSVTFLQFNPTSTIDVGRGMLNTLSALIASVAVEFTTLAQHCTGPAAHRAFGVAVAVAVGVAQALDPDGPNLDLCASTIARNGNRVKILRRSEADDIAELCGE